MVKLHARIRTLIVASLVGATLLTTAGCDFLVGPEQRYERAQSKVAAGDYRSALVELKNALQKQPDLHAARALLAEVALWLGDPTSAEAELNRLPQVEGPDPYVELRVRIDLALGRFPAALEKLNSSATQLKPAHVDLYRGLALQAQGKTGEAQQAFRAAAAADPELIDAQVGIIDTLAAQGDLPGALALATQLTEKHPQSAVAWYSQGSMLARSSKTEESEKALLKARELAGKQLEVTRQAALLSTLIEIQLASRNLDAARGNLEAMNRLLPGSPLGVLMSARVSMAANDYAGAASSLRRLVNGAPQFTQARYLLGVALVAQGNLEQASIELGQVVEQVPQNLEARQLLAQVRMRLQDPDGALRVLVPAIETNADDSRLTSLFEGARVAAGADRQTLVTLEKAVQAAPNSRGLQVQLASAYLQAGSADKAVALLRKVDSGGVIDPRREAVLLQAVFAAEGQAAARAQIQSMLSKHPNEPVAVGMAAGFYARTGDLDKGRSLLTEALAKNPKQPELLFALGRVEWAARKPDAAKAALQRLVEVDPNNNGAQLAIVEIDLAQGNAAAATSRLEALHQADPKAVEPPLMLARLALAQDDAKRADEFVKAALESASKRGEVLNTAGLLYLSSGRFDQAQALFKEGTAGDAGNPMLWLNLGRAQLGLNQRGPARESLEKALSLQPEWLPAVGALAFLEVQEGNGTAALNRIQALKQSRPNNPSVLSLEGEVYAVLQKYSESSQAYDAAAALRPSGELASKSYQMRVAGKLPNAVEPLERWSRAHPDDLAFRNLLADAYIKSGEAQQAIDQYQQIVQRQPKHVPSLNNLAWLYHQQRDPRALATARQAQQLAPQVPAVMDTLGWILVETGQLAEGLPLLEKAANSAQASPDIKFHYAAALARSGAKPEAKERLAQLLANPANFDNRAAAQRLLNELGGQE
ncbi:XrtA/PEP-CTERM system TPR-repeat protein PrsT [Steroidobacter sp.]|uniref:XrtA/PEP-CTERM system TPR-repeat protein PrsT n=1 Tax=Steroidobacter sp. TaxID=1978227 RepID=UPI001A5ABC3E|nr:XrtA/PEP-CTERM system TPR-repeat protein PrsT [Steroidobacter sp.]MBL8266092.1 PEP-CTERM system TPR-repeat protein PrsT [Steroidobacter sp.]